MDVLFLQYEPPSPVTPGVPDGEFTGRENRGPVNAMGLGDNFLAVAAARSWHPAVVTKSGVFTYGWLRNAALCIEKFLRGRRDYRAGGTIALQLANSPEYIAAFYGVLLADCVVAPLPAARESSKRRLEDLCQASLKITRAEEASQADRDRPVEHLTLHQRIDGEAAPPPASRRSGADLAMLLFTSGSTGAPKAVMLSHLNLLANARSILHELPIQPADRAFVVLPFCHALGNSILQTHILSGATLLLSNPPLFPPVVIQAMHDLDATSFSATPEIYERLFQYGRLGEKLLEPLKYMVVAGGALHDDLWTKVSQRVDPVPFYVMYGQSEAAARLTSLPPQQFDLHRGSIGKAVKDVELAVMDESKCELPAGSVGMLYARGDNVMLGYWQDAGGTADVLGADGWLKTGDLAHRDANGYFYLHGRANLLIKIDGHRVHPAEIEDIVEAQFPEIRAVAIPMTHGNDVRFALFVASRNGGTPDLAAVRTTCQRELLPYKVPAHFQALNEIPFTPNHKVDRSALALLLPKAERAA